MKAVCSREDLDRVLEAVGSAATNYASSPILGTILISTNDKANGVNFAATNLKFYTKLNFPDSDVLESGAIAVPARRLVNLIKTLNSDTITFQSNDKNFSLQIKSDKDSFKLMGSDPGDFPEEPKEPEGEINEVTINGNLLIEGMRVAAIAALQEKTPTRPAMNGVVISIDNKRIMLFGTDGTRLSQYTLEMDNNSAKRLQGIIPIRATVPITKFISFSPSSTEIRLNAEHQFMTVKSTFGKVLCRLIEEDIRDYSTLFPEKYDTTVSLETEAILSAAKKATIMTDAEHNTIVFEVKGKQFIIKTDAADVGTSTMVMETKDLQGKDISVRYKLKTIIDGLQMLKNMRLPTTLQLLEGHASLLHGGNEVFKYLFMPVKESD